MRFAPSSPRGRDCARCRADPTESCMSYINKPKVAHPSLPTNELGLTRRQYEGSMSTLCAGCGHDSVTAALVEARWELSLQPQQLVNPSGISCSPKPPPYFSRG